MFDEHEKQFQEFRADVLNFAAEQDKNLVDKWLRQTGYAEPIAYSYDYVDHKVTIYARRLGILIGKGGCNARCLKVMLFERFNREWNVSFKEINGGFLIS